MAAYSGLPLQRILFGPPGCGKSYRVRSEAESMEIVGKNSPRFIETTFHPEYSYSDFTAKLLPHSSPRTQQYLVSSSQHGDLKIQEGAPSPRIEYRIHAGPLLKALAVAYAHPTEAVLLAIDEINRGNCAHIFGDIFQLLDRSADGWSEYGVDMCDLFVAALEQELRQWDKTLAELPAELGGERFKLRLPPNLSILATMNTSDESVYYMDTAFKRRWDFHFMDWDSDNGQDEYRKHAAALIENTEYIWRNLLRKLNAYIADKFIGRNVDDKQVGMWFLKSVQVRSKKSVKLQELKDKLVPLIDKDAHSLWHAVFSSATSFDQSANLLNASIKTEFENYGVKWPAEVENRHPKYLAKELIAVVDRHPKEPVLQIPRAAVANKLMFFLWDNVFSRDRTPLADLLGTEARTFGEFVSDNNVALFIEGVMHWQEPHE